MGCYVKMMKLNNLFNLYNKKYFKNKLIVEKLYIVPSLRYKHVWGWCIGREIHISPAVFEVKGQLEKTLYHEMCHLIHPNHGKKFQELLRDWSLV